MFLLLIISQIVDLKMIRERLWFIKCYQCGGETLVPVVKHSVSDTTLYKLIRVFHFVTIVGTP
jgi:translation initiation factor 2 beta subunit (eIF-2beta)/eIF-5